MYGFVPHGPQSGEFHGRAVDLVTELEHIHALARGNLEASSFKYKELADKLRPEIHFQVGDYVWAMHSKERFQTEKYNKLKLRKIGPVEVLEKINPNCRSR